MATAREAEIERNYAAFTEILQDLIAEYAGKYALFFEQKLEGIFETPGTAARSGFEKFGDRPYSIQLITDRPVDLGFMSNAIREGASPR